MRMWFLAIAVTVLGASVASAQTSAPPEARYRLLGYGDRDLQFIDESSVRKDGANRIYSILVVEAPQRLHGNSEALYAKILDRVDCAAWTVKFLSLTLYTKRGPEKPVLDPAGASAKAIKPGSGLDEDANFVCKGKLGSLAAAAHLVREADAVRSAARFFAASTQSTAEWDPRYRLLGVEDADVQFIDEKSIKEDGTGRDFSLLVVWPQPRPGGGGEPEYLHADFPMRVDCPAWTLQALVGTIATKSGSELRIPGRAASAIPPGSVAEAAADYVCKGKLDPDAVMTGPQSEGDAMRFARRFFASTGWGSTPSDPAYRLINADEEVAGFLDESSIERGDAIREYWMLAVSPKPVRDENGVEHSYARFQLRIDCAAWTTQELKVIPYTKSGSGRPVSLTAEPQRIDPGSAGEAAADFLCKGRLDPAIAARPLVSEGEAVREARNGFAAGGTSRDGRGK
ncbi:MAG TPA: surface-adhesin E family protein [Allosphingosinicella sp.]|nr:surface-adhesin E family protein [Allosphingosinicella sp.]